MRRRIGGSVLSPSVPDCVCRLVRPHAGIADRPSAPSCDLRATGINAAQVAASCILLIVAGLLGRALDHAASTNPGFEYRRLVSIAPGLSGNGYSPARSQAIRTLRTRIRALPGVQSVSLTISPPLGNVTISAGIEVDGRPVSMQLNRVDPQFFETMKIPLLRGRNLKPGDTHAAVISESMARLAWPGQDALGKTFTLVQPYTVVGICGSVRLAKFGDSDSVQAYLPVEPGDQTGFEYSGEDSRLAPGSRPRPPWRPPRPWTPRPFPEVQLLSTAFRTRLEGAEYSARAVSVLSFIAHLLACLGIVGVVAYAVSQRTKEIGIRMALGAQSSQVLSVVLRQFSRPVVAGLIVGLGGAAALSQVLTRKALRHQQFRSRHLSGARSPSSS